MTMKAVYDRFEDVELDAELLVGEAITGPPGRHVELTISAHSGQARIILSPQDARRLSDALRALSDGPQR